jgi:hypothetical protein
MLISLRGGGHEDPEDRYYKERSAGYGMLQGGDVDGETVTELLKMLSDVVGRAKALPFLWLAMTA